MEIVPFMTVATLVSNIGGLMGLWLGVSAISLMEVLEKFLTHHMLLVKNKLRPKNEEVPAISDTNNFQE